MLALGNLSHQAGERVIIDAILNRVVGRSPTQVCLQQEVHRKFLPQRVLVGIHPHGSEDLQPIDTNLVVSTH